MSRAGRGSAPSPAQSGAGHLLQALVNLISHRESGQSLAIMNDAGVTLHQALLLRLLRQRGPSTPSALAGALNMSLPSVSQMVERLFQQDYVQRAQDTADRRKSQVAATTKALAFLDRLGRARSAEYEDGITRLPPGLRAELVDVLGRVLLELQPAPPESPAKPRAPKRSIRNRET